MIAIYLVGVTALGVWLSRRTKSSADWAVGGGGMGIAMMAAGIAGTRIGGVGTYGVAGNVITEGIWGMWYAFNTFLAMALVGFFYAVPYRRLKLSTVAEIFLRRFNSNRCTVLTSLCVQTEYLIVNILEPFLMGKILQQVAGISFGAGVAISAAIIIFYTAAGGLRGTAATNIIHCSTILIGLMIVGLMGMSKLGGWSGLTESVNVALEASGKSQASWWSIAGMGWGAVLAMFFSVTIHTPGASVYVNFASSARTERTVLPAFLLAGLVASIMPLLSGWIGMQTLATYGADAKMASYQRITQLATDLNPWVGGIAVAAILAALISSAAPILLASSTMFVNDWLPFTRKFSSTARLRSYRITTVIYGLIASLIAYKSENSLGSVLDLLLLGFAAVVPPAIAVGFLIYWRRTTEPGAFWGMALGYGFGLAWWLVIQFAKADELWQTGESGLLNTFFVADKGIDPTYITTLVPLLAVPLISLMTRPDKEREAAFYATLAGVEADAEA